MFAARARRTAGGALNFLTVGALRREEFFTYVSWDLFGHEEQKRRRIGRYELLVLCDEERWCLDVLTHIGRQSLQEAFEPGDTLDIGPWVGVDASIQGVVFEEALCMELHHLPRPERCSLLRCVGVTRPKLEFAISRGVPALVEHLKRAGIPPRTIVQRRESVALAGLG